jgi:excisionase family DNA binding protein
MHSESKMSAGSELLKIDPDVVDRTKLGRSTIYRAIACGALPSVRIGRSLRVERDALELWIRQHSTGTATPNTAVVEPAGGVTL